MKSEIINSSTATEAFPCLRKVKYCEEKLVHLPSFIVLFTDYSVGTVVHSEPGATQSLGVYSRQWSNCNNPNHWEVMKDATIKYTF